MAVEQVYQHKWPSGSGVWLIGIAVRIDFLARAISVNAEEWQVDGLGFARGTWLKLSTGRVVLIYELEHGGAVRFCEDRAPMLSRASIQQYGDRDATTACAIVHSV